MGLHNLEAKKKRAAFCPLVPRHNWENQVDLLLFFEHLVIFVIFVIFVI